MEKLPYTTVTSEGETNSHLADDLRQWQDHNAVTPSSPALEITGLNGAMPILAFDELGQPIYDC
jgi:hypothetical protein